jgi:hypothetical protein
VAGHLKKESLPQDVVAQPCGLDGRPVAQATPSDEHSARADRREDTVQLGQISTFLLDPTILVPIQG